MREIKDTLRRVQIEVGDWALQFGDNESKDPRYAGAGLRSMPAFIGMVEELGELAAPIVKRHQGRGFEADKEYYEKVEDSLADLLIFMCDFANREGISLTKVLSETWETVKNRRQKSWAEDKAKELGKTEWTEPDKSVFRQSKSTHPTTIDELEEEVAKAEVRVHDLTMIHHQINSLVETAEEHEDAEERRKAQLELGEWWVDTFSDTHFLRLYTWKEVGDTLRERLAEDGIKRPAKKRAKPKLSHLVSTALAAEDGVSEAENQLRSWWDTWGQEKYGGPEKYPSWVAIGKMLRDELYPDVVIDWTKPPEDGPDGEDGPWAEGYDERAGMPPAEAMGHFGEEGDDGGEDASQLGFEDGTPLNGPPIKSSLSCTKGWFYGPDGEKYIASERADMTKATIYYRADGSFDVVPDRGQKVVSAEQFDAMQRVADNALGLVMGRDHDKLQEDYHKALKGK